VLKASAQTVQSSPPGFVFPPLQPRRKSSVPGGSAAKVFEPAHKKQIKTARRGEFFAARPAGSISGNSGMSGAPFLGSLSFGETKESD
jgi:hypothetical protein